MGDVRLGQELQRVVPLHHGHFLGLREFRVTSAGDLLTVFIVSVQDEAFQGGCHRYEFHVEATGRGWEVVVDWTGNVLTPTVLALHGTPVHLSSGEREAEDAQKGEGCCTDREHCIRVVVEDGTKRY